MAHVINKIGNWIWHSSVLEVPMQTALLKERTTDV
jgi:hypothetical protein